MPQGVQVGKDLCWKLFQFRRLFILQILIVFEEFHWLSYECYVMFAFGVVLPDEALVLHDLEEGLLDEADDVVVVAGGHGSRGLRGRNRGL